MWCYSIICKYGSIIEVNTWMKLLSAQCSGFLIVDLLHQVKLMPSVVR